MVELFAEMGNAARQKMACLFGLEAPVEHPGGEVGAGRLCVDLEIKKERERSVLATG